MYPTQKDRGVSLKTSAGNPVCVSSPSPGPQLSYFCINREPQTLGGGQGGLQQLSAGCPEAQTKITLKDLSKYSPLLLVLYQFHFKLCLAVSLNPFKRTSTGPEAPGPFSRKEETYSSVMTDNRMENSCSPMFHREGSLAKQSQAG